MFSPFKIRRPNSWWFDSDDIEALYNDKWNKQFFVRTHGESNDIDVTEHCIDIKEDSIDERKNKHPEEFI